MRKLILTATVALAMSAQAKVTLPYCLGDNMILQQNTEARLWGKTTAKEVKVTTSWDNAVYTAKASKKGDFIVKVKTPAASYNSYSVTFDDGERLTVNDVLIGEVWVCAGQSNMEMPVKGFGNCRWKDITTQWSRPTNTAMCIM